MEKCCFCDSDDIVWHNEHYVFCKSCTAIYTNGMLIEKNCNHITEDSVCVDRLPWFKELRKDRPYIKEVNGEQVCSVCGKEVVADGW